MNYIVGNFVFIPSSTANHKGNRIKLCRESVIKINFLTSLKAFIVLRAPCLLGSTEDTGQCSAEALFVYSGYQRFFSRAAEIFGCFGCRPKPRAASHYKDLTETGNRARKVSGTQGIGVLFVMFA